MSIRSDTENLAGTPPQPSENKSNNFLDIPACNVQDVDEAVFRLFDKQLPLYYTHRNDTKRVPIIFATGERFALLARKKPLRDRSKALILPVVSIMRKSYQVASEIGMGTNMQVPQLIKKQLSPEDPQYQNVMNKLGLNNSDDLSSSSAFIDPVNMIGALPGRVATRRPGAAPKFSREVSSGNVLSHNLGNNIVDVYEIPPPIYITVDYEVTMWTQYLQEMNKLQSAILSEAQIYGTPSFRIESDKNGYYFVLMLDKSFSNEGNADDFSEDERLIRSTFSMKATGYILGASYIGASSKIKRTVSAPQISFEMDLVSAQPVNDRRSPVATGNANDVILENLRTVDETVPSQDIGGAKVVLVDENHMVGGSSNAANEKYVRDIRDPFNANKVIKKITVTKTSTNRSGETIYREVL